MKLFSFSRSSNRHTNNNASISNPPVHKDFSDTITGDIIGDIIDSAESIIKKCDIAGSNQLPSLFTNSNRKEAKIFLERVTSLQMHYYNSNSEKLIRANSLMPMAMKLLQKEFYRILLVNRKYLDSESSVSSSNSSVEDGEITDEESRKASDMAMEDLKSIAECMIASGYGKDCINIYGVIRKSVIDEALYNLGVEKLSLPKMQKMEWRVLEARIKRWLDAVRVAVKTVFQGERALCDVVFSSFSETVAESCFAGACGDAAVNLFKFAENFGRSRRILSPEKMFRALDMHEAVSELWPEIESVFSHKSLSEVRAGAEAALVKLGEAVRVMLKEFEAAIKKDASKSTAGGGVHPLTRYVMNFLVFLGDYSGAMSEIVASNARNRLSESCSASTVGGAGGGDPEAASLADRLGWLIMVLLCRLDGKAAKCNDGACSYLFLANNLNYVVSKVRNSNLGILVGLDWISEHGSKVNQYRERGMER